MSTLIEKAETIARKAHEGQFRRDGVTPYITHPERVVQRLRAQGVTDEVTLAVGWLHDVIEDTDYDWHALFEQGVPSSVLLVLDFITKVFGEDYDSYLKDVQENRIARTVKIADILDNLSDAPTEKQIVKYAKALLYLHGQ